MRRMRKRSEEDEDEEEDAGPRHWAPSGPAPPPILSPTPPSPGVGWGICIDLYNLKGAPRVFAGA